MDGRRSTGRERGVTRARVSTAVPEEASTEAHTARRQATETALCLGKEERPRVVEDGFGELIHHEEHDQSRTFQDG